MSGRIVVFACLMHFVLGVFDSTQKRNLEILASSLQRGYSELCNCDIDQGVVAFYGGGDPQDVLVESISRAGNLTMPLKDVNKILNQDFDYSKKTIIYINGFYSPGRDLMQDVRDIVNCSDLYNILTLDFARTLPMLYNTALYNVPAYAYAVLKILNNLYENKISKHQIVLVGHSQGAQIASLAAQLFHGNHAMKLPLLVALDPAIPCNPARQYVNPGAAGQVLVIHTNGNSFGLKESFGTVDYYPNGIEKLQPGCKNEVASHEMAVQLFAESVCKPGNLMAIRCKDWGAFEKNMCFKSGIVPIGLRMPPVIKGKYFSITKSQAPYGLGYAGISPGQFKGWWNHDI